MSAEPLTLYLNDHLAGAVAGINLMESLADQKDGTALAGTLRTLAGEVREDQELVREILDRLNAHERRIAQAAAWVGEKVTEGRFALAGRTHPALAVFEALESIALGLQGKLALVRTLAALQPSDARLSGLPLAERAARTAAQHTVIEEERLAAAREALSSTAAEPA
jgi:hypothetical protein